VRTASNTPTNHGKALWNLTSKARVGAAHRNKPVRIFVAGAQLRIVTEDGELLRALTLDPKSDYQPLNGRWPCP
jgi:hypothetical protein